MQKPHIVVIGLNGNAVEALETIELQYRIVSFLDDAPKLQGTRFEGVPVEPLAALDKFPGAQVVMMIGSERSFRQRGELIAGLGMPPGRWARVIHPAAQVSRLAQIGHGVVLSSGVFVGPNTRIGDHVIVLPNSVVHHDSEVADFTLIGSNVTIAGRCRIGASCYIGSAASVRNGMTIGDGALIGMAANVVRPVKARSIVAGNPARPLKA